MRARCVHGFSWFRCQECPSACGHAGRLKLLDGSCAWCEVNYSRYMLGLAPSQTEPLPIRFTSAWPPLVAR